MRAATAEAMDRPDCHLETVTEVEHYTDRLFRFRTTRPASLRFRSGEFVMIGLPGGEKPVFRAYSIASPNWDDALEFFSIKVPGGPLTERLQKIVPGDGLWVKKKPTGTLVLDALAPGRRLWMLATGTGVAPFASLVRDPETWEKFEEVVLTQTCRTAAELRYAEEIVAGLAEDPLVSELAAGRVRLYTTVTREPHPRPMRITTAIESGRLFSDLGTAPFSAGTDRVMICGSMEMLRDCRALCLAAGLTEGSNARPAEFVVERAFAG
ncbi:ferredoxin--NADP reductase [Salinarimonas rosea]|uniref:ferredoxin--NADP reductase n=1 Tax=Salinarimonas rosea TaxID=552063 RepID=UPI0005BA1AAD|nr:ferredoxin--NADP reductase [Salinarimonas rosea]